jgi:eukaryotic-like serine/threonine-protein kinase
MGQHAYEYSKPLGGVHPTPPSPRPLELEADPELEPDDEPDPELEPLLELDDPLDAVEPLDDPLEAPELPDEAAGLPGAPLSEEAAPGKVPASSSPAGAGLVPHPELAGGEAELHEARTIAAIAASAERRWSFSLSIFTFDFHVGSRALRQPVCASFGGGATCDAWCIHRPRIVKQSGARSGRVARFLRRTRSSAALLRPPAQSNTLTCRSQPAGDVDLDPQPPLVALRRIQALFAAVKARRASASADRAGALPTTPHKSVRRAVVVSRFFEAALYSAIMAGDRAEPTGHPTEDSGTLTAHSSAQTAGIPEWRGNQRFEVVRRIGEGGMGVVYEALDRERGQIVALKSLLSFTPAALFRFKQEFRTLADVQHPNLVRLYELVATEGDNIFFTMELVSGSDFLSYVRKPGTSRDAEQALRILSVSHTRHDQLTAPVRLSADDPSTPRLAPAASPADFDRLRRALRQLVEGVKALHGAGKLHRDIKPSNVLVTPDGRVVILDFGVATDLSRRADANLSETDEVVGTVRYMAPEQAMAETPTPASDWYSVGVVLYEALVGRAPFTGSAVDVLSMKSTQDPLPPAECVEGVPADLDALCRALLDPDPAKRPTGWEILKRLGTTRSLRPVPSSLPVVEPSRRADLVGRERQLASLREAFEQALSGHAVTVRVAGASGMGKSAVATHFLEGLVGRGEALVLRGRAYERESVPYKAVDSVVDALSRHLVHLEEQGQALDLPGDIGALSRVFPVLRRVASIGEVAETAVTDPNLVRRRAFSALRSLLGTLSARQPLVIYIDDAQWGDADSAALLLELVRPPDAPPVLYVMTQRDEEADTSLFLKEMRRRWPEGAEIRDITVGPLDPADAKRLALALLDRSDELAQRTARAAARESRGSPFLVEELVRHNVNLLARENGDTLDALTLRQMVAQRLERLPADARRLLEIVAVSGRPLAVSLVAQASGTGAEVDKAISAARARRLLRTGLRDGSEIVETSHDAFRQTIVAQLAAPALREHHEQLARALEAAPGADPEAIAVHLLGAGDGARGAQFAEHAAEEAIAKLAFDHAARLLRMALETHPSSSGETRRLRARLATVYEWAGLGEEAARAYLEAAEGAPSLQRAELERAASIELLASGRMVEGCAALHRVVAAVGLSAPQSVLGAVFWLIVHRVRLAILSRSGFRYIPRPTDAIPRLERARVDSVYSAAIGFAFTNVILATCMAARSLLMALRFGDRFQIMRAAGVEASQHAGVGGKLGKLERTLADFAQRLAEEEGTALALAFVKGNQGVRVYLRGEWKKALEMLDDSTASIEMHDHSAGWQSTVKVFACWSLNFLGEHRELAKRHAALLDDAERRGDMFSSVQLRDGSLAILRLVADDPEGARREAAQAMAIWPDDRYLLQHWHRLYGEGEIELYVGDGAKAYARVDRDSVPLKKSLLLKVQHMRVQTAFLRGRCAIASLEAEPAMRVQRLAETRRLARRLEREGMGWSAPFAAILDACVAHAEGDRASAIQGLKAAIDRAVAADMAGYATAARHQLGLLLGGEEGGELVARAEEAMRAQGVRVPARFASTLVPGRWSMASTRP